MVDIVVVGGANLDVKATLPEGAVAATSNPGTVGFSAGGVGRNIAHNLARLGVHTSLITVFGNDTAADALAAETLAAEVDLSFVVRSARPSGSYVALLDDRGELVTAVNDMRLMESLTPDRLAPARAALDEAEFIIADCNIPEDTLVHLVKHFGHKLMVDPVSVPKAHKLVAALDAGGLFAATPNRAQLSVLGGAQDVHLAASRVVQRGVENLVVHLGAEGACLATVAQVTPLASLPPARIVDVTGAGDAAVAGLAFGLWRGMGLADAARLGQAAAGLVLGSSRSTLSEIDPAQLYALAGLAL